MLPLTVCFQPLAWILYYSSKICHFSATIFCILLQDCIFAWLFSVTRPKMLIHFYVIYHISFLPRSKFRTTTLIQFSLQTPMPYSQCLPSAHTHSLNNPGYQGVNLKTSLADINSKSKFISAFPSCLILHFLLSILSFLFGTFQADFAFMVSSLWAFWSVFFSICPYYLLLCIALVMHAWSQTISSIN